MLADDLWHLCEQSEQRQGCRVVEERSLVGELNCSTELSKSGCRQRGFGSHTKAKAGVLWSGKVLEECWGSLGGCRPFRGAQ